MDKKKFIIYVFCKNMKNWRNEYKKLIFYSVGSIIIGMMICLVLLINMNLYMI